jgi:hypothetical protein
VAQFARKFGLGQPDSSLVSLPVSLPEFGNPQKFSLGQPGQRGGPHSGNHTGE